VLAGFTGNRRLDIVAKPRRPREEDALGGKMFVVFLESV